MFILLRNILFLNEPELLKSNWKLLLYFGYAHISDPGAYCPLHENSSLQTSKCQPCLFSAHWKTPRTACFSFSKNEFVCERDTHHIVKYLPNERSLEELAWNKYLAQNNFSQRHIFLLYVKLKYKLEIYQSYLDCDYFILCELVESCFDFYKNFGRPQIDNKNLNF